MNRKPDPAFPVMLGLLILTLLASGIRVFMAHPRPRAHILPGTESMLITPEGEPVDLAFALPPGGNGSLFLFRFPGSSEERIRISRAWRRSAKIVSGKRVPVVVAPRLDRVRNLAAWMGLPPPLCMDPEVLYTRLRIPGIPALLVFVNGELKKCRVMVR